MSKLPNTTPAAASNTLSDANTGLDALLSLGFAFPSVPTSTSVADNKSSPAATATATQAAKSSPVATSVATTLQNSTETSDFLDGQLEFRYYTYYRGHELESSANADTTSGALREYQVICRACDQRLKKGMRCQGGNYGRVKGASYSTFVVDIQAEFAYCKVQANKLKELECQEAELALQRSVLTGKRASSRAYTSSSAKFCAKAKKAKISIVMHDVGATRDPTCTLTVSNMDEHTSLRLALILTSTLFHKPIYRAPSKRTKLPKWDLIMDDLTYVEANILQRDICTLLYAESSSGDYSSSCLQAAAPAINNFQNRRPFIVKQ